MRTYQKINFVFITILTCAILGSLSVQPAQAQEVHYYAGYTFNYNPYTGQFVYNSHVPGVYGQIITIDPNVPNPTTNVFCEWVTMVLSYSVSNWVQIGYSKGGLTLYPYYSGLRYYVEVNTTNYYAQILSGQPDLYIWRNYPETVYHHKFLTTSSGQPANGEWHSYATRHPVELSWETPPSTNQKEFRFYKDNMGLAWETFTDILPTTIVDAQAFAETTSTSISITGTHFRELHIYDTQLYYYYWNHHIACVTAPYTLTQTSDNQFYANGGG